jgi:ferritin
MDTQLIEAFEKQIAHEFYAAQMYLALSNWCAVESYNGFAAFYRKQAAEEREHAEKFIDHLVERGVNPSLLALPAASAEIKRPLDTARLALELEQENSRGIRLCYELALELRDYASQPLLLWFISEQVEEESWAGELVTKCQRSECPGALFNLDRHIVKDFSD